jgi:type IV fimbrial biogenesis protein FimT
MMKRAPRGLTMIELAITLAVLAVLGAIAVPSLSARANRQRLQDTAELLAADLADARFDAARSGQALYLEPRPGTDWCWAVATAPDCGCDQAAACQLHRVQGGDHPGVRLVTGQAVRLDPAGTTGHSNAAVFESRAGEQLRVDVSALGRARICTAAGQSKHYPQC